VVWVLERYPRLGPPHYDDTSEDEVDEPVDQTKPRPMTETRGRGLSTRGRSPRTRGGRPPRVRGTGGGRPPRVRGRSRTVNRHRQPEPESSSWEEVDEEHDAPYQYTFQYSEISGPKHCSPTNSKPINYFNLLFMVNLFQTFVEHKSVGTTVYCKTTAKFVTI
jgi:hypothetical protein